MADDRVHLLAGLRLPSRYESLVEHVGDDVARLLVAPTDDTQQRFERAALAIKARTRGLFAPMSARTGAGKTTLASNLTHWLPRRFTVSAVHRGPVTVAALRERTQEVLSGLATNDDRVIPLTVEDRESSPPSDEELAQMKGFLRTPRHGSRCLLLWPETDEKLAIKLGQQYASVAGNPGVELPLRVDGPPRETWSHLAITTMQLVNGLESLEDLGVDPNDYDPAESPTVGDYLDTISADFVSRIQDLLHATRRPVRLAVVFASQSEGSGILDTFTGTRRFGLVEPQRLLAATPQSDIGRYWSTRRGLLTSVLYRLDTRVIPLPPSTSIPILRRLGPPQVTDTLKALGVALRGEAEIATYLDRSDLGKFAAGHADPMSEIRGRPSPDSPTAFELLASDPGFGGGRDKPLNRAIGDSLRIVNERSGYGFSAVTVETKLEGEGALIPDVALIADNLTTCLEFHWRKGDFLTKSSRSEIAQYVLTKVRSYGQDLGWLSR